MSYHDLPQAILTHLAFTLVSVLFGLILGVVLGILLSRRPKLSKFVLPVLSVFNTIPGIVFVGLLFIWLGMFLDWAMRSLFFCVRFVRGRWMEQKVI